jgi:hypothetical protein
VSIQVPLSFKELKLFCLVVFEGNFVKVYIAHIFALFAVECIPFQHPNECKFTHAYRTDVL